MSLSRFKVLTFDVVGTLIDFESGIINHVREIADRGGRELSDEEILESYRKSRGNPNKGRYPEDLVRGYKEMEADLKLPYVKGAAEGLRDSVKYWPAFPDSVEALGRLRRHFRIVAMTNAQDWALAHMARTLGEPFDDRITVDDTRCEKPDEKFFAFALGRLSRDGYRLEDNLHVAQSQYHDIGTARKLGYTVCWIERRKGLKGFGGTQEPEKVVEPDYHFGTLRELADAVEQGPQ